MLGSDIKPCYVVGRSRQWFAMPITLLLVFLFTFAVISSDDAYGWPAKGSSCTGCHSLLDSTSTITTEIDGTVGTSKAFSSGFSGPIEIHFRWTNATGAGYGGGVQLQVPSGWGVGAGTAIASTIPGWNPVWEQCTGEAAPWAYFWVEAVDYPNSPDGYTYEWLQPAWDAGNRNSFIDDGTEPDGTAEDMGTDAVVSVPGATADGSYEIVACGIGHEGGTKSYVCQTMVITIGSAPTPPSVVSGPAASAVDSGTHVDGTFTITSVFDDNGNAISGCQYTTDGAAWSAGTVSGSGASTQCQTTGATCTDGASLTINMRATNVAGTTTATAINRTCDTVAPTTTATPGGGYTFNTWTLTSPISITLASDDGTGSGIAAGNPVYCVDTTNSCAPGSAYAAPFDVTCVAGTTCTQYVRYKADDNVGNAETVVSSIVKQDTEGPTQGVAFNVDTGVGADGDIDLSWDVSTDTGSGLHGTTPYKVMRLAGGTPPADCATGTQAYNSTGTSFTDGGLSPGATYSYRLCSYDALNNEIGIRTGTAIAKGSLPTTTTVTDTGTEPGAATVCPGAINVAVDSFVLNETSGNGASTVSAVQVTLSDFNDVSTVYIKSNDGLTTYGSAAVSGSNVVNVSLGTNITVGASSSAEYKVYLDMTFTAAVSQTATVTDITVTGTKGSVSDGGSSTLTISADVALQVINFLAADNENSQSTLTWKSPNENGLTEAVVMRKTGSYPANHTDGVQAWFSAAPAKNTNESVVDSPLTNGTPYYYAVFYSKTCYNETVTAGSNADIGTPNVVANNPPNNPTIDAQYKTDGTTVIAQGGVTDQTSIIIKATVTDPDTDNVSIEAELVENALGFTGTPNCTGSVPVASGGVAEVTCTGLLDTKSYKWQVRAKDINAATSAWVPYGGNPDVSVTLPAASPYTLDVCAECHGMPPIDGSARNVPAGAVIGNHSSTTHVPTGAASECEMCHGSQVASYNFSHRTGIINMASDIRGGTYSKGIVFDQVNTPTLGACNNTYCHGAASPTWGTAGTLNCGSCHPAKSSILSAKHSVHYTPDVNATSRLAENQSTAANYVFNCGMCHNVDPGGKHVDQSNAGALANDGYTVDIVFGNIAAGGAYAKGSGATATGMDQTGTPGAGYVYWSNGQCLNVYCHSDGKGGIPNTPPEWDGVAFAGCADCHDNVGAKAVTNLSARHGSHMGSDVYAYSCDECHTDTVNNNSTNVLKDKSMHVNGGVANVVFSSTAFPGDTVDQSAGSYAGGQCSSTYCHSDGKATFTSVTSPLWSTGTIADCVSCHKGKDVAGLGGRHPKHIDSGAGSYNYTCDECHTLTVANNSLSTLNAATGYASHVNGARNIAMSATAFPGDTMDQSAGTWSGTQCNNTYCHSDGQEAGYTSVLSPLWATGNSTCTSCHNSNSGSGSPMSTGNHQEHVNNAAVLGADFECATCHLGTLDSGSDTVIGTGKIANHVNGTPNILGAYIGSYVNATNTCSNIYCHSSGQETNTFRTVPSWGDVTNLTCNGCHGADNGFADVAGEPDYTNGGSGTNTANSHQKHVSAATDCVKCHSATVDAAGALLGAGSHLSGTREVSGAEITGYNEGTETCSNIYCHGEYVGGNQANDPVWGGTQACGACHNATNATPPATNAHQRHAGQAAGQLNLACSKCHGATAGGAGHVSADVTWSLDTADSRLGATAAYSGATAGTTGAKAPSAATGTCSNIYCHSTVQNDGATALGATQAPDWDNNPAVTCSSCHAATPATGSHAAHTGSYSCTECHSGAGDETSKHADYNIDVAPGFANFTSYSQGAGANPPANNYGTCNAVVCHGGNSPTWGGGALLCTDCHGGGADVDDFVYNNGTFAKVNTGAEWTTYGHGAATGDLPLACTDCHDSTVGHGNAVNPFRLKVANNADFQTPNVDGWNSLCYTCHNTGSGGMYTGGSNLNGLVKIDKYHQMTAHTQSGNDGGRFCWDCHDPHGDDANIKMIQGEAARTTDGTYGVPTAQVGAPIVFTDNTAPTGAGGFAMTGGSLNQGLCNACHTASASNPKMEHYNSSASDSHNSGTLCTNCHKHSDNTTVDGDAFKGAGNCTDCHNGIPGTNYVSRDVMGSDFAQTSRHIFGGTPTDWDCVVCHGEGDETAASGGSVATTAQHENLQVEMRNVDSPNADFVWDKNTPNYSNMDSFCLSCHDANGASGINVKATNDGVNLSNARALTPFNTSDGLVSAAAGGSAEVAGYERTSVLDIKSKINDATFNAWHQISGYATAYTSKNGSWASTWVNKTLKNGTNLSTLGEAAKMHCADCHTVDQNAHGGANIFMLTATTIDDVCWQCHSSATYNDANPGDSRFDHSIDATRTMNPGTGSIIDPTGSRCRLCHGGNIGHNGFVDGYGGIHGMKGTDARSGQPRYRFIGGNYMSPWLEDWTGTTGGQVNCYFDAADKVQDWATCGQHSGQPGKTDTAGAPQYSRGLPGSY